MTWGEATEALSALSRKGTRIVVFEGGEPFLWRDGGYDFSDLVAYAKKRFFASPPPPTAPIRSMCLLT